MHLTKVKLKNGKVLSGSLWEWRPREGWFTLTTNDGLEEIRLAEVAAAFQQGQRVVVDRVQDVDLLQRARKDGWNEQGKD